MAQAKVKGSNPAGLVTPKNPYSQVASTAGLVTVSGQLGNDAQGVLAGDFAGQVRQALANLGTALAAESLGAADILHLRHYLVDRADLPALNEARTAFLDGARPASTLIIVAGLGQGAVYEVDAIAAR